MMTSKKSKADIFKKGRIVVNSNPSRPDAIKNVQRTSLTASDYLMALQLMEFLFEELPERYFKEFLRDYSMTSVDFINLMAKFKRETINKGNMQ